MGYVVEHQLWDNNELLKELTGEYSVELLKLQLQNAKNISAILDQSNEDDESCG